MIAIAKLDPDQRLRLQTFLNAFRFASLLAAVTLLTALPSHAWTYYSGASVGSDGTIHGWVLPTSLFSPCTTWPTLPAPSPAR